MAKNGQFYLTTIVGCVIAALWFYYREESRIKSYAEQYAIWSFFAGVFALFVAMARDSYIWTPILIFMALSFLFEKLAPHLFKSPGQKRQTSQRNELAQIKREWAKSGWKPPSLEEFLQRTPIPPDTHFIVHKAHSILGAAYKMAVYPLPLRPAQAKALVQQFIMATILGLNDYAKNLPLPLRSNARGLFTYYYTPTSEELEPANRALASHFDHFSQILPYTEVKSDPRPTFVVWDETKIASERKAFERKLKDYDKYVQGLVEAQSYEEKIFSGTSLYRFANDFAPERVELRLDLPAEQRFAGAWIVAPPGRGKTNLLHNLVEHDRQKGTVILMDSKGDLINAYRSQPDVIVIEPRTANINPLQLGSSTRSVELLEYIFSALLDTTMTPLQKTLFRSVLSVLLHVPNATLETFRQVMTVGWRPLNLEPYIRQCDPATQDFFLEGKKPEFDSNTYSETKQQILWRLRLILSNDYLRQIFTSPTTNVPFSQLLDSRKLIIIDNSKDDLGEEGAEFFGRFFIALVWMAAISRSRLKPEQKVPVFFYIDECHTVIRRDTKVTTILDECRSQKIALTLAHQRISQIEPHVIDALNNCAIRMANSDDDAEALAKRFRLEAAALRLPLGQFACFVRDTTPQAVTIQVPLFDTSKLTPQPVAALPPPQQPPPPPQPKPAPARPVPKAAPPHPPKKKRW